MSPTRDAQVADLVSVDAVPADALSALDVALEDTAVTDAPEAVDAPAVTDTPTVAGPYPDGPYASREGTVLANLAWEGYVNLTGEQRSTELPFGPVTFQELRGGGRGYALLHLAEFL